MNVVNRVLVVILLLVIMVTCTITLVFPVRVLDAVAQQSAALADFLRGFERYHPEWFVRVSVGGLLALVVDIVLVLFLIAELRRPAPKAIRVEKTAGGEVRIGARSIADRLKYEIDQLPSVLRTKPKVSGKRGGVVVELDVETATGIDVPGKSAQILELARQVVEEKMGLTLARPPRVNLRVVSYPKGAKARATPQAPAEPKEAPPVEPKEALPVEQEELLPAWPEDSGQSL